MTATLPVRRMVHPTDLAATSNGIINPKVHTTISLADGTRSTMHHRAAAALHAMDQALLEATGYHLGSVGMWRPYAVQEAGFRRSYLDHYDPARCTLNHQRTWLGLSWYLLKGTLPKATPGRSEHGWGLANDCTIWRAGTEYPLADRRVAAGFAWLQANALRYGYSWAYPTLGTDDPHLQYFAGDQTPPGLAGTTPPAHEPADPATVPPPTTRAGNRGPQVEALQRYLAALHLYTKAIDGIAGTYTITAIRSLQTALGFTGRDVDGIYGPATAAAAAAHPPTTKPTP